MKRSTRVTGANYVRHIPRQWPYDREGKTLCGRMQGKVNCIALEREEPDAECERCQTIRGIREESK